MGTKYATTTSTQTPPSYLSGAYQSLVGSAGNTAGSTYTPYAGGINPAQFTPGQNAAVSNTANLWGMSQPFIGDSLAAGSAGLVPASQTYQNYMNPFLQNQVSAFMRNQQEVNAQGQQQVIGNAIAKGAMGGNRVGVAQSELARQQGLATDQALAELYSSGYGQALGAAQNQQQMAIGAGNSAIQAGLAQTQQQYNLGQQQQGFDYSQYLNRQSFPYMNNAYLASILTGLGGVAGGTTSEKAPQGNLFSQLLGAGLGIASMFKDGGVVRPRYAAGGIIPYANDNGQWPSYMSLSAAQPFSYNPFTGANDNFGSYVPTLQVANGRANFPEIGGGSSTDQNDILHQFPDAMKEGATNIKGWLSPKTTLSGWMGGSGYGDFADGGVVRPHYADGGIVLRDWHGGDLSPLMGQTLPDDFRFGPYRSMSLLAHDRRQSDNIEDRRSPPHQAVAVGGGGGGGFANGGVVAPSLMRRGYAIGGAPFVPSPWIMDPSIPKAPPTSYDEALAIVHAKIAADAARAHLNSYAARPAVPPDLISGTFAALGAAPDASPSPASPPAIPDAGLVASASPDSLSGLVPTIEGLSQPPAPKAAVDLMGGDSGAGFGGDLYGSLEKRYGLPPGYLTNTARVESSSGRASNNVFQFMPGTAREYGVNPTDLNSSADGAARMAVAAIPVLSKTLGRTPSGAELYLAHQQGAAGAAALLANPSAPAASIVGMDAVVGNGGDARMTAGQFAALQMGRYAGDGKLDYGPWTGANDSGVVSAAYNPSDYGNTNNGLVPYDRGSMFTTTPDQHYNQNFGDAVKSLMAGKGLNLSPDRQDQLQAMAFGMMASKSPFFLAGVGEGGMAGMQARNARINAMREDAKTRADIAQQGQNIAINAGLTGAQLSQLLASAAATRYTFTPAAGGVLVTDARDPRGSYVTPWDSLLPDGTRADRSTISSNPNYKPPRQTNWNGSPASSVFNVELPASVPFDPLTMNPATSGLVAQQTMTAVGDARTQQQAAISGNAQLQDLQHSIDTLPNTGWLTPGEGFEKRLEIAKGVNAVAHILGSPTDVFPADQIAAGEDASKVSTRLAYNLTQTLGSGEAASIVMASMGASPGAYNTKKGAERIINALRANSQRQIDYYYFLQNWTRKSYGSLLGADEYFNAHNPAELYALSAYVSQGAMLYLRAHPDTADEFNRTYGNGRNVAQYVLR